MVVKAQYFGMIAERLEKAEESLTLPNSIKDVRPSLIKIYPILEEMSFTIAIDQEIKETIDDGETIHEISIFPPFAGG